MNKIRTLVDERQVIYMGIDVHENTYHTSLFYLGEEIYNQNSTADYHYIKKLLQRYNTFSIRAVYEAGAFGYTLYDALKADGVSVIVTPPSKIPRAPGEKVKTDSRDCRNLSHLLSAGLLKSVTVPSKQIREDRELMRTRTQLVDQRRRIFQQIQSKLRFHGLPLRFRGSISMLGRHTLLTMRLARSLMQSFEFLLETYDHYTMLLRRIRKQILLLAEMPCYAKAVSLLKTIPGVGLFTALDWLFEVPSMDHFKSADHLASFLGLTAREASSGESQQQGRITKNGNARMRWMLIQSAWVLIRKDAAMARYYERLKNRRGGKKAIVAVARKLTARMRAILNKQKPYELATAQ